MGTGETAEIHLMALALVPSPSDSRNDSDGEIRAANSCGASSIIPPDSTTSVEGVHARMREAGENRLRILLVDDHLLLRQALRALLDTDPALEVVGEARTVTEALKAVDRLKPELTLTDLSLPDGTGIDLAFELRARGSLTRIFILSAHATPEHVKAALNAGVLGYALKDLSYA